MNWLIFFLMLPHLNPASFEYLWPTLETVFNLGRVISALIILYMHLLKRRLPSAPVWVLLCLQLWQCLTTLINGGDLYGILLGSASNLAVMLLIDLYSNQMETLVSSIFPDFEIMIYINLWSVLKYYPGAMYIENGHNYRCYFLGYHNGFIIYVLPLILIGVLYWRCNKTWLRPGLAIAAGSLSIIITWSATSVCFLLVLAIMFLIGRTPMKRAISFPLIFIVTITADLLISVFRVMDRVMWITWYIETFLKKQVTLTGRTYIWDEFYELFKQSPVIGYGNAYKEAAKNIFLADHAHNQWFQMLLLGGIVGLSIFLLLNFLVGKRLMMFKHNPACYLFLSVFTAQYVAFIAEQNSSSFVYILYILAYHVDKFKVPETETESYPKLRVQKREFYEK